MIGMIAIGSFIGVMVQWLFASKQEVKPEKPNRVTRIIERPVIIERRVKTMSRRDPKDNATEKAQKEAEEKVQKEAEEKAQKEAEEKAQKEREQK